MRTLSSTLAALSTQQYGSEPVTVVKVEWSTGTKYYTDKEYVFGAFTCESKILELATISTNLKANTTGYVTAISINLDDTDGTIKSNVNSTLIPGTKCTVYQTYNGISVADSLIILVGRISNDIKWSEGTRTFSFTIDTAFTDKELGYAPKYGDVAGLSPDSAGRMWPIVFGSVIKSPTLWFNKPIYGKPALIINKNTTIVNVQDGNKFPQNTPLRLATDVIIEGSFSGDLLTITEYNSWADEDIIFDARPTDPDETDPSVAWIVGTANLRAKFCYCTAGYVNYCYKQVGNKCWFSKPWKMNGNSSTVLMPGSGVTKIDETARLVRGNWGVPYIHETVSGTTVIPYRTAPVDEYGGLIYYTNYRIAIYDTTAPTYIVNNAASTAIKGVYAVRDGTLEQVPSSYYTKNLNTTIGTQTVTTITLNRPLSDYADEKWEDEIYVTLVSSLSSNTATAIKYLLDTYSSYATDSSFAAVAAEITRYPSNFTLTEQRNVLDLVSDIAFQARLALIFDGAAAKIKYLSKVPSTVLLFNDDNIASKSITYGFTSADEIITKYIAKWSSGYGKPQEYVYKNNNAIYGTLEGSHDFFIYNIESLVKLSANFWGNRKSYSWRTAQHTSWLNALKLESFDCVSIATPTLLSTGIRGEVTTLGHDTGTDVIAIETMLASKSGSLTEDTTFFTGGVTGTEATPADPTNGVTEIDYDVPVEHKNDPEKQTPTNRVVITGMPTKVVRGVPFSFNAKIVDDREIIVQVSKSLSMVIYEETGTDIIDLNTVAFVNGVAIITVTVTNDSTDRTAVINILGDSIETERGILSGVSEGFIVTSETVPVFTVAGVVNRSEEFPFTVTNGRANYTYSVSYVSSDPAETLKLGTSAFTTFTTDASGGWTGNLILADGLYALDAVNITVSSDDYDYPVPEILVLDTGAGGNIVVETAKGSLQLYDTVMNSGSAWVVATETDGKTYGIVAAITATNALVVCRGFVCIEGLTEHTNYGIGLLADGAGFVLRHYESNLCWVGGGSPIARLNQIGDVDATVTLASGMIIKYNGTKWVPGLAADLLYAEFESTDSTIETTLHSHKINLRLAQMAARSVIGNSSATVGYTSPIIANADGDVLQRGSGTLFFGQIGDSSISGVAWGKITGAPSAYTPAAHNQAWSTITTTPTTLSGYGITDGVATNDSRLTDARTPTAHNQAWSTITARPTTLAGYGITDGMTNPMTTAGDIIIGGTAGAPTRLAVNAGGTTQILVSQSGVTSWVAHTLDAMEDVTIATPVDGEVLTYEASSTSWKNKAASGGGASLAAICYITGHGTSNTQYTVTVYPHGRPGESGDVTWTGVTAYMLQIGATSPKVPVNTWCLIVGTKKIPNTSVGDATDYNWYIQPPIWM